MSTLTDFTNNLNNCRKILLSAASSFLHASCDAEDVVQKASIILWNKYDTFDKTTDFVKWAYTVVILVARNTQKSTRVDPVLQNQELYDELSAQWKVEENSNTHRRLDAVLEKLNAAEKALLEAVYIDGISIEDYASMQGKPRQTLYNQLCEIKKRIRHE
jgi:RNA polymerase sigma-70 factor (ECF subfamily)